ncbi:uncharacterized protein FFMR_09294 [Fusarium fujikuroi]|nr:uncharacterized protein FFMR_09294 [Fusarium fujikuroi]
MHKNLNYNYILYCL